MSSVRAEDERDDCERTTVDPIELAQTAPDLPSAPSTENEPPGGFKSGERPRLHRNTDPPESPGLIGRILGGRYVIEAPIGSGAMGAVFRGRQILLGNAVAIKVMHAQFATDPTFGARFFREAKAATLFDHPSAVRVIDFGEEPDRLAYIVTELVHGRSLATMLHVEWPLSDARVVSIVLQLLGALGKAHDAGLVHRDIKPENVLLVPDVSDDDERVDLVKVCDFGIAQLREGPALALTEQGYILGTPEYMSPEQAEGKTLDGRSDIYSVGVVLFQMLTGELPFQGDTPVKVLIEHIKRNPDPPSQRRPQVDPRFDAICLRAMAKQPEDRYADARAMRRAIRMAFLPADVAVGAASCGELPLPAFAPRASTTMQPAVPRALAPQRAPVAVAPATAHAQHRARTALASALGRHRSTLAWLGPWFGIVLAALVVLGASVWLLVRRW
jgi:serine/threonine protein kinase